MRDDPTPEQRALNAICYVNAVGWEDGEYGGPDSHAYQRLRDLIAEQIREAIAVSSALIN